MEWITLVTGRNMIAMMMLLCYVELSDGQVCIDTDNVNIQQNGDGVLGTGRVSIITRLNFSCNGTITRIRARVRCSNCGGNERNFGPFFQVWQADSVGSTVYNKIGEVQLQSEDQVTTGSNGFLEANIILTGNNTIRFQSGDVVGYYDPGNARYQARTVTTAGYLLHHNQFSQSPETIDLNNFNPVTNRQPLIQFTVVHTGAPRNVTVTVSSSHSIMLSWEQPALLENGPVLQYHVIVIETQIHYTDDGVEITGMQTYLNRTYNVSEGRAQLIDSLHPDYNYTIRVAAVTEPGVGLFSDPITVRTEMDVPTEAPRNVNVTVNSSHNSIMLTWERPSPEEENGLLVCYHVIILETQIIYFNNGTELRGMEQFLNRTYNVSEGRMQLIDMLQSAHNYTVRIAAATGPGIGPFSDPITVQINVATVIVTSLQTQNVTAGRSFTLTCNATGFPVPSIEWTLNGISYTGSTSITIITLANGLQSNTSSITVTDAMANDTGVYECMATNIVNTDTQNANVTVQNCPDPPNNLQIFNVNSRNLTINWTKPHDNNDPITDYFVQYLNPVCLVDANILPLNMIANSTEEQVVISDLHPGEDFTFSVIAVNNICPSQFSLPSSVRTMEEVPGVAPVVVSIVADQQSINISWRMLQCQDRHGNITTFEVRYTSSDFGDNFSQTLNTSSGNDTSLEVSGLEEFANYTIEVRAYTAVGPGPYSSPMNVLTLPNFPSDSVTNLNVRDVQVTSVDLSWGPVSERDRNGIILSYNIYYRLNSSTSNVYMEILGVTERSHNISGLLEDEVYLFAVTAVNQVGESMINTSIMIQANETPPGSPVQNVMVSNVTDGDDIAVFITWDPPSNPNGIIQYYRVEFEQTSDPLGDGSRGKRNVPMDNSVMNVFANITSGSSGAPTNVTLNGLVGYRVYNYSIFAATSVGEGPSADGSFLTREDTPLAPENLTVSIPGVSRNSTTLLVNWERPLCDRGILSGYELCYVESSVGDCDNNGIKVNITGADQLSYTINNLSINTNYTIDVRGRTGAGIGDPATATITTDEDDFSTTVIPIMSTSAAFDHTTSVIVSLPLSTVISPTSASVSSTNDNIMSSKFVVTSSSLSLTVLSSSITLSSVSTTSSLSVFTSTSNSVSSILPSAKSSSLVSTTSILDTVMTTTEVTATTAVCADDFSGALFWNGNRRNKSVTQPCSRLHPSFRSGVNIERHCNNDGTWSSVDMTNCTTFVDSNPVITVHFTLIVNDSNTAMDSATIINNVLEQIQLSVVVADSLSNTWSYMSDSNSLLLSFMVSVGLQSATLPIATNLVNDIKNSLRVNASSVIPSEFVLTNEGFMILAFQPNSSCLCNDTDAVRTVCWGPSTAPCTCSTESCRCNTPTYIGNDHVCGLDSDSDGFPDESVDCSEPFCSKDVCPDIFSVTNDGEQSDVFCHTEADFTGGCPFGSDKVWNITWPATNTSTTARQKCPGNSEAEVMRQPKILLGIATRQCNQNGEWKAPDVSQCRTVELTRIETRAEELITVVTNNDGGDLTDNFRPEDVVNIADQLNEITNTSTPLVPNDIISTANTLNIIILIINMTVNDMDQSLMLSVIEDTVDILNSLLDPRNDVSFQDISTQSLEQGVSGESVSEQLLMNTEQVGILLVSTLNTTNNENVRTIGNPNIAVEAQILMQEDLTGITSIRFPTLTNTSADISLVFGGMTPTIEIPSTIILRQLEEGVEVPIINIVSRNPRLPTNKGQRIESLILSSQISTDLQRSVFLDGKTVQLTFNIEVTENNAMHFNPRCAFFRFSSNSNESGEFLTDGITQSSTTNNTFVQCTSIHLTSFAVLVDKSGENDDNDATPLFIVGYIGCAISIVCLLFTIGVLIILRKKAFNQVQHFLHLNLCIALLIGLVTFVSGIETAAEYRESCLTVAVLLHYIFMAAFCWMLCEGMLLFITLNFVFYTGFLKSRKFFFAIGWGLPVPIVAVSAALSHEYYGINDRCWISEENGAIWAFIGPMLLIILVNIFFLIAILFRVYKSKHQNMSAKEATTIDSMKASLKAAIIVIPILGSTWVFGILAINENTVVFAWIFTILNSLQGAFIMFFYVLRNDTFIGMIKYRVKDSKIMSSMEKFIPKNGSAAAAKHKDHNSKALAHDQYNEVICNEYFEYEEQQKTTTFSNGFTPSLYSAEHQHSAGNTYSNT